MSGLGGFSGFFGLASRAVAAAILGLAAGCTTSETLKVARPAMQSDTMSGKYAAVVVDGNNGRLLYAANADAPRYPASLTKMMTLYMVFEALDSGRLEKTTLIQVSDNARRQPPTKMGFKPGGMIDIDSAIRALATKSANDVAVAVGEHLGGSEERFAAMMTAKARAIGMRSTVFRNASGLPDPEQRTSARDMAVLGLALRQRFPHHYDYFSVESFAFNGRTIRGHNRLLGRVEGVDGIKTGYIRASGFNIVTSVNKDGHRLVAVVMGGDTAAKRDQDVENLILTYLPQSSGGGAVPGVKVAAR